MRPKPFEKGARGMAETVLEISTHENSLWWWFRNLLLLATCSDSTSYEISINVNSRLLGLVERLLSSFLSWDEKKCELGTFQNLACFCCVPTTLPTKPQHCKSTGDKTLGCFCYAPITCLQNLKLVRNCDLGIAENMWTKVVKTTQETAFFGHSLSPTWPTYFFMRPKPFEKGARGMAETVREISMHIITACGGDCLRGDSETWTQETAFFGHSLSPT